MKITRMMDRTNVGGVQASKGLIGWLVYYAIAGDLNTIHVETMAFRSNVNPICGALEVLQRRGLAVSEDNILAQPL